MPRRRINHTDRRYGKLTLLHYIRSGGPGSGAIWRARCDCGSLLEVVGRDAASGKKSTCGRCSSGLGIAGPEGVISAGIAIGHKRPFRALVRYAENMPGRIQFTTVDYNKIVKLRCVGCNVRGVVAEWADPTGGATPENLIPICLKCSRWREGRMATDWLEHCMRVANNAIRQVQHGNQ